ncbi:MAG: ImmA/IrrE family metallo-endopeptidase, partial [Oscillospiraceae bacterium]|nr:ImmA/IrrE family metallo-endopeptidase [Oscillospiraceae bacterium]
KRYTVMHELGHFLLGHLGETPLSRSEYDCRPSEEQAADKFAIDMLAPACVLWGLHLHRPEEIAKVCNISMQAAGYRAERMKLLYQRNKFLSHPLERRVYAQFSEFIRQYHL